MMTELKIEALMVYSTRYGATKGTSEEIGRILQENGFNVKLVNAKEEKISDISDYGLVVVGSGMSMGNWGSEAEDFVKRFRKDLVDKKLALFVSSLKPIEDKTDRVDRIRKVGLDDKILKYNLKPIMIGLFGGKLDFNKMNVFMRKAIEVGYKGPLAKHGFKESESGVYDLRDWTEIRSWAKELAVKAKK